MQIKKIASFDVRDGASTVRYADLDDGISFFPTDGIINIKSNKVRIAGFGVDANSLYRINSSGAMYPLGDQNSVFLSNKGLWSGASIGGSRGSNKWVLAISNDFGITDGGALYARNANITGAINASRGKIADYKINGAMLVGNNVGLSGTSGQGWAFWAGSNDAGSAPFRVGHDGSLFATNADITGKISANIGNIGGWDISEDHLQNGDENDLVYVGNGTNGSRDFLVVRSGGEYPFWVRRDGTMFCNKAIISGNITAREGQIASYTISGDYLMSTDQQVGLSAGDISFWAGYNTGDGSYKFKVTKDGYLYATNANISGTISNSLIKWGNDYGTIEAKDTTMRNISGIGGQGSNGMIIAGYLGSSVDIGIRANSNNSTDPGQWDSAIHINGVSTVIRNPGFDISSYIEILNGLIYIDANFSSANGGFTKGSVEVHGGSGYYTLADWMCIYAHTAITGGLEVDGLQNGNGLQSAYMRYNASAPYMEVKCANDINAYGVDAWLSDARLKNTIKDTPIVATPVIEKMKFKQFNWNDSGIHVDIGLIAQDLEKINPDLIMKIDQPDGSVIYQVNATMMSTITAKAVQETISKVDTLESNMNLALAQAKSELEMKLMVENQKLKDRLTLLEEKVKFMNGEKSSYSEG